LSDVVRKERQKFIYSYDFGDDWRHEVLIEKISEVETGQQYPICLAGARACPPEDVGGAWGYEGYLEALGDPTHEQHDEFLEWAGAFDPEKFDAEAVNRRFGAMQRVAP